MGPDGIHHITCVTDDAAGCVRFYTGLMGLRLVKRTVNQDVPDVWHLFLGDDRGSPGADLTFFEFRGLPRGVPGPGAAHTIRWRVAGPDSLGFWEDRLCAAGIASTRGSDSILFADPEGLGHELVIDQSDDTPLRADSRSIPIEHALRGFDGVRIHADDPLASASWLRDTLEMDGEGTTAVASGPTRSAVAIFDTAPQTRHVQGAGSIHHIAWSAAGGDGELETWRLKLAATALRPTPIVDRFWFHAVYFRATDGVLHELSTPEPGFTVDEPLETLGTKLVLPPALEPFRSRIEAALTPLPSTTGLSD